MATEYVVSESRPNCRVSVGTYGSLSEALDHAARVKFGEVETYVKGQMTNRRDHRQVATARKANKR